MSRAPINMFLSLSGRRGYAVAATREVVSSSAEKAVRTTTISGDGGGGVVAAEPKKEICWMPDPRSGNWVPENRFDEVDVAGLRAQHLSKKQ
ncbi:protein SENESCENCE-ASSOCIATED GENE 21, mitochondrial-like [Ananas comosus]|uniref:Protein SENESCENCE-ASSOCIATED GENE 21, mitochondrial-like n=1 Tax=Ananas comosus TaxID=4615 RepID=A0A6P5GQX5_ANACO|nr:protein SENESCENCE-ASSOCIATED GENE 21, mitochondrial-like [Ananas comosus]